MRNILQTLRSLRDLFVGREVQNLALEQGKKAPLHLNLDELKIISTALLHYRRRLAKRGELDDAVEVIEMDQRIYQQVLLLENIGRRKQPYAKPIISK